MAVSDEAIAELLQRHGFDSILRKWKNRATNAFTKTLRRGSSLHNVTV